MQLETQQKLWQVAVKGNVWNGQLGGQRLTSDEREGVGGLYTTAGSRQDAGRHTPAEDVAILHRPC